VWLEAGAAGIGIGGELYRAGHTAQEVHRRALQVVAAWRTATAGSHP
jgi:2-dehydro-3-deoxyphosphogalactonate aldolase